MTLTKKLLVLTLTLVMVVGLMSPGMAGADEVADLQAQITALLAQLGTLQAQLTAMQGGAAGAPAACAGITFSRNLSLGSTGNDVKCLQALLNADSTTKVAASGVGSSGSETLYFGNLTKAAVVVFQNKYASVVLTPLGLTAGTGYVGAKTREKLNAILTGSVVPPVTYTTQADCEAALYFWYGSACHTTAQPAPTADLTVELASDTPAAGLIYVNPGVAGSANNVATRIKLTAGPNPVTVTSLKVTKYGTVANGVAEIARVKVYEGANQLSSRALVTNSATFTFAPALSIAAGSFKTLDLMVDLTAGAIPTANVALGVEAATDVTASVTASGTFPIRGSTMSIASAAFGGLTVTAGVNPPITIPRVGENDRVLANYVISSGAVEDLVVQSITITEQGTAADGDVTDIKLKSGTELIGAVTSFGNRRAVVVVNKALARGASLQLQLTGDITSGATRTIWPALVGPDAVVAKGTVSGVLFIAPVAGLNVRPAAATAPIQGGGLTVTPNVYSPTDNLVNSVVPQTIGIFDVRGTGENVVVQNVALNFAHAPALTIGYLAALYDEAGGLQSNVVAIPAGGGVGIFNLGWTIPANTVKKLYVKAFTTPLVVANAARIITVGVGPLGFAFIGELSGAAGAAPAAGFALPGITYRFSGQIQFALNTVVAPINQTALFSTAENFWTAIAVIATREDISITSLQFDNIDATVGAEATQPFVTCSLYDMAADGSLTSLDTQPWNFLAGALGNVLFNNINSGGGITVPLGAANAKTFAVKCSVAGAPTAGELPELDIVLVANVTAVGAVSGTNIIAPNVVLPGLAPGVAGRGAHILATTATGGVLYVKPNASSPSGNVSRSGTMIAGIWDLTAKGVPGLVFDNIAAPADHNAFIFTSFTGGLSNNALAGNTRLVDATTGVVYATGAATVTVAAGTTLTFTDVELAAGAAPLAILQDQIVSVRVELNTTSTVAYPQYSSIRLGFLNALGLDTGANAGPALNNGGGLPEYPAGGIQARCPEIRIQ